MSDTVRVRFPPSPTGEPHVGNIRTAIFNWLFARGAGGSFVIRIEDTDQSRKVEGAVEAILETLRWLGVDWDEGPDVGGDYGPYVQSERLDLYRRAADDLLAAGRAYDCYCEPDRLAELRRVQGKRKERVGYDSHCRDPEARERAAAGGGAPVVRFTMPTEGTTSIRDLIRGEVTFENALIDDFVILKSDGFPTYHLASVVDDNAMRISHVLRAEEWLPSAPRHVLLYRALGLDLPQFAHLPIILAPDRSKLSKRHGATSALEYREMGYLPQAMVNFLTLLGWSLDDRTEIFSKDELFTNFSLERVSRSGAVFSADKLAWLNGHYIRESSPDELADALLEYWGRYPAAGIAELPARDYLLRIVPLVRERLKTLGDAAAARRLLLRQRGRVRQPRARTEEDGRRVDQGRPAGVTDGVAGARRVPGRLHRGGPAGAGRRSRRQGRPATRLAPRRHHGTEGVAAAVRDPRDTRPGAVPRSDPNRGRPAVAYARYPWPAGWTDCSRSSGLVTTVSPSMPASIARRSLIDEMASHLPPGGDGPRPPSLRFA